MLAKNALLIQLDSQFIIGVGQWMHDTAKGMKRGLKYGLICYGAQFRIGVPYPYKIQAHKK